MLTPWLDDPAAAATVASWSALAGLDLAALGTTGTAEEITDTAVTQPLIVAASLLGRRRLTARGPLPADTVLAGHSIGEITAAAVAGVISDEQAITLAAVRGRAMAAACAEQPTTMAAVLGGVEREVLARLTELGLVAANRNTPGQIVAAGAVDAIDELVAEPPTGARIRRLAVAGAFHTHYMGSAREALAAAADRIVPADPAYTLLSNSDGLPVTSGADALAKIVEQMTSPVRWDLCLAYLRTEGVGRIFELPPGATLVGMARREFRGVPAKALKAPADADDVLLAQPAGIC